MKNILLKLEMLWQVLIQKQVFVGVFKDEDSYSHFMYGVGNYELDEIKDFIDIAKKDMKP